MKSILSSGYGRLHLAQSADWLGKAGVNVKLICGWVPQKTDSWLVRLCSKLVGRDISPGLKKRRIKLSCGGEVISCAWADFFCQGLFWFDRKVFNGRLHGPLACFAWKIFGWQTLRYLKKFGRMGNVIFHVRSGAGQGGAIKKAKEYGMKVLVDHSALHPAQTEINLRTDYKRWGVPLPIAPNVGVWKNVLKDCAEADILMVNAKHIRDSFVERGFDPAMIRVVYLGVRDDFRDVTIQRLESGKKNDVPLVLFSGNFSLLKGAEYLLESLMILDERGVKVHYDIVGSLNVPTTLLEKYVRFKVSTLESGNKRNLENPQNTTITFHGQVPPDDLKLFLAESDIYIFPSLADGCAQSGMEALTAGLPVVATYQSGLPITDGETGCVVPMKDAIIIADKIEWLIANPQECERLGRNAAKMMRENYTWEKYAENVKKIYQELSEEGWDMRDTREDRRI